VDRFLEHKTLASVDEQLTVIEGTKALNAADVLLYSERDRFLFAHLLRRCGYLVGHDPRQSESGDKPPLLFPRFTTPGKAALSKLVSPDTGIISLYVNSYVHLFVRLHGSATEHWIMPAIKSDSLKFNLAAIRPPCDPRRSSFQAAVAAIARCFQTEFKDRFDALMNSSSKSSRPSRFIVSGHADLHAFPMSAVPFLQEFSLVSAPSLRFQELLLQRPPAKIPLQNPKMLLSVLRGAKQGQQQESLFYANLEQSCLQSLFACEMNNFDHLHAAAEGKGDVKNNVAGSSVASSEGQTVSRPPRSTFRLNDCRVISILQCDFWHSATHSELAILPQHSRLASDEYRTSDAFERASVCSILQRTLPVAFALTDVCESLGSFARGSRLNDSPTIGHAAVQSGVANLVGSLWPVIDDSAFLFTIKFYVLLLDAMASGVDGDVIRPSDIVRRTQAFMREGYSSEFLELLADPRLNLSAAVQQQMEAVIDARILSAAPSMPFADPVHWATFCVVGKDELVLSKEVARFIDAC
jgi:hypothetical protein